MWIGLLKEKLAKSCQKLVKTYVKCQWYDKQKCKPVKMIQVFTCQALKTERRITFFGTSTIAALLLVMVMATDAFEESLPL